MKCSFLSKLVNWLRSVPVQGCAFPARSTPDHKSYRSTKGTRDDQQSHYSLEGGDLGGYGTQGLVCHRTDNEHTTERRKDRNRGEAPHYCGRARSFDREFGNESGETLRPNTNDPFMKVKKLIQDLIWKQQWKFLRKTDCDTELSTTNCPETSLREEVYNANFIRNEEKATNEEDIKDVQEAQSNLTQAIQILTNF